MTGGRDGAKTPREEPFIERFRRNLHQQESMRHAEAARKGNGGPPRTAGFPYASVSVLVILLSLFLLSMHLGGWGWSSWTYAFSLSIAVPLVVIELKRKAVITGGAILLLFFTVLIDAGLPQYFGYSPSDLSWYDLGAHFLGAFAMTFFLWSVLCWTSPQGPPATNGRLKLLAAVTTILIVSMVFEMLELATDAMFGWVNYRGVVDTAGDLIFDFGGVAAAATIIARHRIVAMKLPFWYSRAEPERG